VHERRVVEDSPGAKSSQPNGWWIPENHHPNEKDSHLDPNLGKYPQKKTLGIEML